MLVHYLLLSMTNDQRYKVLLQPTTNHHSPLHIAVHSGSVDCMHLVAAARADLEVKGNGDATALHFAPSPAVTPVTPVTPSTAGTQPCCDPCDS